MWHLASSCLYIGVFLCTSMTLTFYYKHVLRDDFPFPLMFSTLSSCINFFLAVLIQWYRRDRPTEYQLSMISRGRFMMFNGLTSAIGLLGGTFDSLAFAALSVSVTTTVNAMMPVWTTFSYILLERGRVSRLQLCSLALLGVAVWASIVETDSSAFSWSLVYMMLVSGILAAVNNSLTAQMMREFSPWFADLNVSVYSSLYSIAGMLPLCFYYEGRDFLRYAHKPVHVAVMAMHLVVISMLGLLLQIVVQRLMLATSTLTLSMLRIFRTLVVICISIFYLHDVPDPSPARIVALVAFAISLVFYSFASLKKK